MRVSPLLKTCCSSPKNFVRAGSVISVLYTLYIYIRRVYRDGSLSRARRCFESLKTVRDAFSQRVYTIPAAQSIFATGVIYYGSCIVRTKAPDFLRRSLLRRSLLLLQKLSAPNINKVISLYSIQEIGRYTIAYESARNSKSFLRKLYILQKGVKTARAAHNSLQGYLRNSRQRESSVKFFHSTLQWLMTIGYIQTTKKLLHTAEEESRAARCT